MFDIAEGFGFLSNRLILKCGRPDDSVPEALLLEKPTLQSGLVVII